MLDAEKLIEEVRKFPVIYDQSSERYRNHDYKDKIWKIIGTNLGVEGGAEECKKKWSSIRDQLRRTIQKRKTRSGQAAHKMLKYKYEDILSFLVPHLGEREGISNVPKSQDDEEENDNEPVDDADTNKETYLERPADEKPTNEEEEENFPTVSGNYSFRTSHDFSNKDKFAKVKAVKRKLPCPEETLLDSPSRQLMAFILAEKEAEKKTSYSQDPVDAFLGGIAPSLKSLNPHILHEAKGKIFAVVQEMELRQLQMNAKGQGDLSNFTARSYPSSESSSLAPRDEPRHSGE